jgi:ribosome biogenesis protein BMS1
LSEQIHGNSGISDISVLSGCSKPCDYFLLKNIFMTEKPQTQENKQHHAKHVASNSYELHNSKVFDYTSGQKTRDAISRSLNIEQIRLGLAPSRQCSPLDPSIIVAVYDPPKSGKSLLIRCLVKRFTNQKISSICGPVTLVNAKTQRLSFLEVPSDLNAMSDVSKIADIVLFLVNAENGFEMETFEFLNLLLSHGFPKVIGIITHLDSAGHKKAKPLKERFKKELSTTVKVYKMGNLINKKYEKKSVIGLSRILHQNKLKVLSFREGRGYLIADRVERENNMLYIFGYSRGVGLTVRETFHICGVGDFSLKEVRILDDLCP